MAILFLQPKLADPNPRHNTSKYQNTSQNDGPVLHMQYTDIERCPSSCANRGEPKGRNHVPRHSVVLVNTFCFVYASIQARGIVLRKAYETLNVEENVKSKSHNGVWRFEVLVSWASFVDFNDDEAGSECAGAEGME